MEPERLAASLVDAGRRFGTPVYALDRAALADAATELAAAFPDPWQRRFSVKANDEPAVIRLLAGQGLGANVVSRGEWAAARRAGVPNANITLEGVGKSDADLRAAVRAAASGAPPAWVSVEAPEELEVLATLARRAGLGTRARPALELLFRINPDVVPETHHGLAVGAGGSKFGLTETELTELVERASAAPGVEPRGVHVHVGSQLGAVDAWRDGVRLGLAIVALLRGRLDRFDTLDVGGGFPVATEGSVPSPGRFAREIPPLLEAIPADRRPRRWAVEPGRFLVARAGWLVARVLHVRERAEGRVVVLDAGMTELVRPALYGAEHPIVALTSRGRPAGPPPPPGDPRAPLARVDGPICETTDSLGRHALPPLERGDLVAIGDAGAYADSMGMRYNGRPRPPLAVIEGDGELALVRRRGRVTG